jgi:hypothetical protein
MRSQPADRPTCLPAQPPPKKATDVEDESLEEESGKGKKRGGAPAQGISQDERMGRTEKGSVVEVLKQEGGLTVLREVKDGEVVSTTVRLTPDEVRLRLWDCGGWGGYMLDSDSVR